METENEKLKTEEKNRKPKKTQKTENGKCKTENEKQWIHQRGHTTAFRVASFY